MLSQIIFSIATVVALFITVQLVKTFANKFFTKISKFVPIIVGLIAILAQAIFNLIVNSGETFIDKIDIVNAIKFGIMIASTEVYSYEGIYKLLKSFTNKVKKVEKEQEKIAEKINK